MGWDCADAPHVVKETPEHPHMDEMHTYDYTDIPGDTQVIVLHHNADVHLTKWQRAPNSVSHFCYMIDDGLLDLPGWNPARLNPDHVKAVMGHCSGVITSTPYLYEQAKRVNKNAHMVRNYLYWPMWDDVPARAREDRVTVGYMGMFRWRQGDLDVLRDVIPKLLKRNPHVDFFAGGSPKETLDYLGVPPERRKQAEGFGFGKNFMRLRDLIQMDVGLVPMARHPFNEAKSHLKGMEYNACWVPYVATGTESYRYYTTEGENGFNVVKSRHRPEAKQWLHHIETLVNDHKLRDQMSFRARATAKAHKLEDHINEWADAYRAIIA